MIALYGIAFCSCNEVKQGKAVPKSCILAIGCFFPEFASWLTLISPVRISDQHFGIPSIAFRRTAVWISTLVSILGISVAKGMLFKWEGPSARKEQHKSGGSPHGYVEQHIFHAYPLTEDAFPQTCFWEATWLPRQWNSGISHSDWNNFWLIASWCTKHSLNRESLPPLPWDQLITSWWTTIQTNVGDRGRWNLTHKAWVEP